MLCSLHVSVGCFALCMCRTKKERLQTHHHFFIFISSIFCTAVATLITLLSDADTSLAKLAGDQLKHTLLVFDAFHDVEELHKGGNAVATEVLESWADAEWYTAKAEVPDKITVTVFKGEYLIFELACDIL